MKAFLFFISLFLFGCSEGFQINSLIGSQSPLYKESASLLFIPEGDQVVSDCQKNGQMCLYFKNPNFQESKTIDSSDTLTLKAAQKFSVNLTGIDRLSGKLKSKNFRILSVDGKEIPISRVIESRGFSETGELAHFINAYYWLNRTHEYLKNNHKTYPSLNSPLSIYVDDSFDGWSYENQSIHLSEKKKTALSADVILMLFGEAQASIASKGMINQASNLTHQECAKDPVGCCKSSQGCSQAILRGVGSGLVYFLFPDAPGLGEFYFSNQSGQNVCGKPRNPESFKTITFNEAYNLCDDKPGSSLALGMVYASIWAEVSKVYDSKKVEKVFLKHLEKLNGEDQFSTALSKIRTTCQELGEEQLETLFVNEFSKR